MWQLSSTQLLRLKRWGVMEQNLELKFPIISIIREKEEKKDIKKYNQDLILSGKDKEQRRKKGRDDQCELIFYIKKIYLNLLKTETHERNNYQNVFSNKRVNKRYQPEKVKQKQKSN